MSDYRCIPLTPEQSEDRHARAGILEAYKAAGYDFLFSHTVQLQQAAGLFGNSIRVSDVETLLFVKDPLFDVDSVSSLDQLPNSELTGAAAAIDKAAAMIRAGEVPKDPVVAAYHPAQPHREAPHQEMNRRREPVSDCRQPIAAAEPVRKAPSSGKRLMQLGIALSAVAALGLMITLALHKPEETPVEQETVEETQQEISVEESSEEPEESKEEEKTTEKTVNGIKYVLSEKSVRVVGYDTAQKLKSGGLLIVSPKVDELAVTEIADGAFQNLTNVPFVKIPESVTKIGSGVFQNSSVRYVFCKKGSIAELYAQQNSLEVLNYSGKTEFDNLEYFPRSMTSNISLFAVKTSGSDVRSGPGTEYASFSTVQKGTIHAVRIEESGWSLIQVDGQYGWVSASDLTLAEDYSGEVFQYANSFFSVELPVGWEELYEVREDAGETTFYHARSLNDGYGGLLFGIFVTQNSRDLNNYEDAEILISKYGYYYILFYPDSTAYNTSDPEAAAEYRYMGECIREILASAVWKDTGVSANFETYFAKNPIDQACTKEHQAIDTAEEGAEVYEKYAALWAKEIDWAYSQLLECYSSSSVEYTEIKTAQQAWQSSAEPLLKAALDAAGASSENPDVENVAAARYAFYYAKAKEVYQKLYNVFPDYTYQYQG